MWDLRKVHNFSKVVDTVKQDGSLPGLVILPAGSQRHSQDFRKGGTEVCRCKFWPHPLMKPKGKSSNYHRKRVLIVASELDSA